ncbi:MAG: CGGC domain-containing protein [Acidobacteriota bacterium]
MTRIGIIICDRYRGCAGGKCFRALRERVGAFSRYASVEAVEIVGYSTCGGCPGGNVESVPSEMMKNGAEAIHLATGLVVGYPPCPYLGEFKAYIETRLGIPVIVGTHPIPQKYFEVHRKLPFWEKVHMEEMAGALLGEEPGVMKAYD